MTEELDLNNARTSAIEDRSSASAASNYAQTPAAVPFSSSALQFNHADFMDPSELDSRRSNTDSNTDSTPGIDADIPHTNIEHYNSSDWSAMGENGDYENSSGSFSISSNNDSNYNNRYNGNTLLGDGTGTGTGCGISLVSQSYKSS